MAVRSLCPVAHRFLVTRPGGADPPVSGRCRRERPAWRTTTHALLAVIALANPTDRSVVLLRALRKRLHPIDAIRLRLFYLWDRRPQRPRNTPHEPGRLPVPCLFERLREEVDFGPCSPMHSFITPGRATACRRLGCRGRPPVARQQASQADSRQLEFSDSSEPAAHSGRAHCAGTPHV